MNSPAPVDLQNTLKNVFGFSSFRNNQEEIIRAILAGSDVFAVMPTGGGKSLCYQLPALLLQGTCLVISPLISLMKDQVEHARAVGIEAGYLNSSLPAGARRRVEERFVAGHYDLLYLAPERLAMDAFLGQLARVPLSFVAVDEAHCLSEWGHDFRPDYLSLALLKERFPQLPVAAFTATATHKVEEDVVSRLGLAAPLTVRASFDRPNLFYKVEAKENVLAQIGREVERHPGEAGIVYRLSRLDVEKTATALQERGIKAVPYHAGLGNDMRHANQEAFNRDEVQVVVATVAFGMGIDKANVRYVIHGDLPKNIEGYYQETGRAGRDGEPAICLLLYNRGDMARLGNFINKLEDQQEQRAGWDKLSRMADFAERHICRRRQLLAYFGEEYGPEKCRCCDVCLQGVEEVEATVEAQMLMSAIYRTGGRFGAGHIVDIVVGARTKRLKELGHTSLKTHGVGRHRDKSYWRRLVDALLTAGCLTAAGDRFPILQITTAGQEILFGRQPFFFDRLIAPAAGPSAPVGQALKEYDQELFAHLKELRRLEAEKAAVPPYVIFSDRSLREMCQYYPRNEEEMSRIHGVGRAKLAHFGEIFLAAINQWLEEHPDLTRQELPAAAAAMPAKGGAAKNSTTMLASGALAQRGLTLEEIATERGLKEITIAGHLENFLSQGHDLDLPLYVCDDKQDLLRQAFAEHGFDYLRPVVESLNGRVSYDEARIMRGYLKGQPPTDSGTEA